MAYLRFVCVCRRSLPPVPVTTDYISAKGLGRVDFRPRLVTYNDGSSSIPLSIECGQMPALAGRFTAYEALVL